MKRTRPGARSPVAEVRAALREIGVTIDYDERYGTSSGEDIVLTGLDHMASALVDLTRVDIDGMSLDAVLAEIGAPDALVERAAELIKVLGRMSYGVLAKEDASEAEDLRGPLYDDLDAFINAFIDELAERQEHD